MSHLQINQEKTTRFLQEMVKINSVNPDLYPGAPGEAEITTWLADTCQSLGLDIDIQDTAPGRPNLIATWRGLRPGKSLLLTGHTDTVSVENMHGNPFSGDVRGGRLYGRGALDMKGGLAAILGAVEALKENGFQPLNDVYLGFVTDEEYASIGMEALVKRIQPAAAILTEPTDLKICIAHKGFAWLTITTAGEAAHGSLYETGVDAIRMMGLVLAELDRLERQVYPTDPPHDLLGRSSVHASTITGGLGLSTYPDQCILRVEHRLLPGETGRMIVAEWEQAFDRIRKIEPQFDAIIDLDLYRPGYHINPDAPIVRLIYDAYLTVCQTQPIYSGMHAWLDSAVLAEADIPTVVFGPGGKGMHAAEEYVELNDVFTCANVIAEAIQQW
ncbi:MAG: M20/M25/M40 family metallo-hydrolase [Chloroflexi bacterium]|nr:MAG: M20/M25/M40 family metallo-hydrolase [Chloroflexota bacterium]